MTESYRKLRGMFANKGVIEVQNTVEALVERFDMVGARIYLEAQLEYMSDLESRVVYDEPMFSDGSTVTPDRDFYREHGLKPE